MRRRAFLGGAAALAALTAAAPSSAHTLYGQWVVYRQKHLLIGCHREDMATYEAAQALVEALDHALPSAKARIARARRADRLASLLATDQLEVAVLSPEDAQAMAEGRGRFAPYGASDLRLIAGLDAHWLVARADFPPRHAWLTRAAVVETGLARPVAASSFRMHEGAAAHKLGLGFDSLPDHAGG